MRITLYNFEIMRYNFNKRSDDICPSKRRNAGCAMGNFFSESFPPLAWAAFGLLFRNLSLRGEMKKPIARVC